MSVAVEENVLGEEEITFDEDFQQVVGSKIKPFTKGRREKVITMHSTFNIRFLTIVYISI